mmetsp:Transcript_6538/g.8834  ORF Transcript_6538/g.8834 Transcript_6538/m.8834 type:complete len:118 (+) Transcript_6538:2-355(+)
MKITFYGGIALAAIAAKKAHAYREDDLEAEELAQNSVGPLATKVTSDADLYPQASSEDEGQSTNLATVESEADLSAHSEGELDTWTDVESQSDSDSFSENENELESFSDIDSENEDE